MAQKINFNQAFKDFDFKDEIKKNFGDADVLNIKILKSERKMILDLGLKNIVDKKNILDLESEIKKFFLGFDIKIREKYDFDCSVEEKIKNVWKCILLDIKNISNVFYEILNNREIKIFMKTEKYILEIKISQKYAFFIESENLDGIIKNLLKQKIDLDVDVIFCYLDFDTGKSYLSEKQNEIKNQLMNEIEMAKKNVDVCEDKKKNNDVKTSFNKKSCLKLNCDLVNQEIFDLNKNFDVDEKIIVGGKIFFCDKFILKNNKILFSLDITDKKNSITAKFFIKQEEISKEINDFMKVGQDIILKGKIKFDDFTKEKVLFVEEFCPFEIKKRCDNEKIKRVELHAHTQMSSMDSVVPVKKLIERAAFWGHKAIAITDHGVVQAFPEAIDAAKKFNIKVIYGTEAYLIDDLASIVENAGDKNLDDDFVVFDLETTGISKENNKIIEIGAVKISHGKIVDRFNSFVNPKVKLPAKIIELTNITDEMLVDAPEIEKIFFEFMDFIKDCVLVAHNADFDAGFINRVAKDFNLELNNCVLDTLGLSRALLPNLSRHKLDFLCEYLKIDLKNHHRAVDDAEATAKIFLKLCEMLKEKKIYFLREINFLLESSSNKLKLKAYHAVILVKNQVGLKNLYKLISMAHLNYFYKRPRIPKSEFLKLREGLIIGSACEAGEIYRAIRENKSRSFIENLAQFYDYLEVQPLENNFYMLREKILNSSQDLININKKIIELGEKFNKLVVATGDVHFLEPEDKIYREIIMSGEGFKDAGNQPPLFFHTTKEMLEKFNYLDKDLAFDLVVKNPNLIADMIDENIKPIPDGTYSPKFDGADEKLKKIVLEKAHEIYGENLPEIVENRLKKELDSIIKNGFTVMYIIAQKLVWKSLEDGYLVGSRGSVGSSFVATMAQITEVNPLPPHYVCPECKYSDFDSELVKSFAGGSGCDMPDKFCPVCKSLLNKDGHDIPFETFLGFDGDKEPDIDLNFSGEYQARAHEYTEELFGEGHVFKAGTIATLAEKTAYGYVKKYFDEKNIKVNKSEINRLKIGCSGVKKTTGQHPGGLMIVPKDHDIFEFCPIQHPANDLKSNVITTHFDYHSISGRLLKLDLLGHDVPTMIYMLEKITKVDVRKINLADKKVLSLFESPKVLGDFDFVKTGTLGLPEFGTNFVRQMLLDTKPKTFGELVRISGLSHGTDVWFNNAQELIKKNLADLKSVIPTRDDIMLYLIRMGVEKKTAFKIMESVRKGRGLSDDHIEIMKKNNVPAWYIESCNKIKYLFPKGHAVAYVMMTMRMGYFKVYYPYAFYAAVFSVRNLDFDYNKMCFGKEKILEYMRELDLNKDMSAKEKNVYSLLELILEMYERGLNFVEIDLYKSDAEKFIVTEKGLLPPLCTIEGLGESVAQNIVEERKNGLFDTIEDFKERTKANKNVIDLLKQNNILRGIPETNQMSFIY